MTQNKILSKRLDKTIRGVNLWLHLILIIILFCMLAIAYNSYQVKKSIKDINNFQFELCNAVDNHLHENGHDCCVVHYNADNNVIIGYCIKKMR